MILSGTDVCLFTLPILPLFTPSAQDVCFYDHTIFFFRSSSSVPVTRRSPSKRPEEGPLPVSRGPGLAYHFSTSLSSTITTLSFSYVKNTKIHQLTYENLRIGTNWHDFKHKTSHDPLDPHKRSRIPVCLGRRFTFLELFARPDTATTALLVH